MSSRLPTLRRVSQLVFLALFVLLFAGAAFGRAKLLAPDAFLSIDPLLALSAAVSLRRVVQPLLWAAVPVAILSVVLGRVFCGWICPMGTTIDACERAFGLRRLARRAPSSSPADKNAAAATGVRWRRLKYYVLIGLLATMVIPAAHRTAQDLGLRQSVGLSAVYLADPIAMLTRTFAWVVFPAAEWATRMAGDTATGWGYSDLVHNHPLLDQVLAPTQTALSLATRPAYARLGLVTFLLFGGIIALGRFQRRFWCRNLCPLGALLGVLSLIGRRVGLRYGVKVSAQCARCLRCVSECKVGAISISEDSGATAPSRPECIHCYSCLAVCRKSAVSVGIGGRKQSRPEPELRLDRRRVLGAIGAGFAAVAIPKSSLGAMRSSTAQMLRLSDSRLIRPPGSLPEDQFVTACVRCGECMAVCPTNTLQAAVGEGGLEALGTPVIVPRAGACAQSCNLCGNVCATRAIEPFTPEEKKHLYVGAASVDRSACIAWALGRECVVCDEACSYNAISQEISETGVRRPVVNEGICVGCGICECVCPVAPLGAIHVSSSGDKRYLSREEQKRLRDRADQPAPQGDAGGASPYPGL